MSPCPRKGGGLLSLSIYSVGPDQVQIFNKMPKEASAAFVPIPFHPRSDPSSSKMPKQFLQISSAISPRSPCTTCTNPRNLTQIPCRHWNLLSAESGNHETLSLERSHNPSSGLNPALLLGTRKHLNHGFLPCKAPFIKYPQKIKIWLEKWSFL